MYFDHKVDRIPGHLARNTLSISGLIVPIYLKIQATLTFSFLARYKFWPQIVILPLEVVIQDIDETHYLNVKTVVPGYFNI